MIDLREKADFIRDDVVKLAVRNGAGHIAPSLSCVDILVALYYDVMQYDPSNPFWADRDRLIFSKSHGGYALYAILSDQGIIPKQEWENFYTNKSNLMGCVERRIEYGIEAGCGSLGHGLPMAVGLAFGAKLLKRHYYTFCICGDGELQEGTTWEALQFAVKHELDNFTLIVDDNRLQAMDFRINIMDRNNGELKKRLAGFGAYLEVCNGHAPEEISRILKWLKTVPDKKPRILLAETIKGYGVKCMENVPKFHFRVPEPEEIDFH